MLSPVRSASGLFWHIISGSGSLTPKSAPITPSFGLVRKGISLALISFVNKSKCVVMCANLFGGKKSVFP